MNFNPVFFLAYAIRILLSPGYGNHTWVKTLTHAEAWQSYQSICEMKGIKVDEKLLWCTYFHEYEKRLWMEKAICVVSQCFTTVNEVVSVLNGVAKDIKEGNLQEVEELIDFLLEENPHVFLLPRIREEIQSKERVCSFR